MATLVVLLASVLVWTSFFVLAPLLRGYYRGALDVVFSAEQTSRLSPANNGLQPRADARGRSL